MKSYISSLREILGSQPLIVTGGRAVIPNAKGEILLHKRSDFQETWSLPGGQSELGESLADTLIREVREETGLQVLDFEAFAISSEPQYETFQYPNGDSVQLLALEIIVTQFKGELNISDPEVVDLRYFPLKRLPKMKQNEIRTIDRYCAFTMSPKFKIA